MIYSFLLIGQSNMAGRGVLGEVEKITDARLAMMRNACWQMLSEPVNYDRPFAGVNLATSFAKSFIDDNPDDIAALIPCADGGSCMDQWEKGMPLYDNAVFCARQAKRNSKLTAILWHQGESDTDDDRYPVYTKKLVTMLTELKIDIGEEDVPVLLGGLGDYLKFAKYDSRYANYVHINEQLVDISKTMKNTYYVSAKNLTCKADKLHFNAKSLREFGLRYYDVFKNKRSLFDEDIAAADVEATEAYSEVEEQFKALQKRFEAGELTEAEFKRETDALIRTL